jgi:cytochrome c oxidase assembly factor CtaG
MDTSRLLRRAFAAALACIVVWSKAARAHALSPDASHTDASPLAWTFEWWVVIALLVSLALYIAGYTRLRRRGTQGRASRSMRLGAFSAGWLALVLALVSPLHALSEWLFSAHMLQHELLMLLAAPLLVIGRPFGMWMWAFPSGARAAIGAAVRSPWIKAPWQWLTAPAVAWTLHAAALWCWHAPRFFESALARPGIHTLQHASFLGSALLFWWTVFGRPSSTQATGSAHAMLSLFTTMVHTGALGALLTLAPGVWYPSCIETTLALGFDPLQDQQLGGLVMWVPGGLAYLIGGLWVGARLLMRRAQPHVAANMSHEG